MSEPSPEVLQKRYQVLLIVDEATARRTLEQIAALPDAWEGDVSDLVEDLDEEA
jgi:hypothetical protein